MKTRKLESAPCCALLKNEPAPDSTLLVCLESLLRRTFSPVRSVKRDLLILLSAGDPVFAAANGSTDGAAGSALLTELIIQLGIDVEAKRESLKRAIILSLYLAHIPIRTLSDAAMCVSLRSTGAPLAVAGIVERTFMKIKLPTEVLKCVRDFAGEDLWWGRCQASSLPRATRCMRAFSTCCATVGATHKLLNRVVCYPITRLTFSTGDVVMLSWTTADTLSIRCTCIRPLVVLLRRERRNDAPRSAAVLRFGGLGDVLL